MTLTDVMCSPHYMVNLGGSDTSIGNIGSRIGGQENRTNPGAFYRIHWYECLLAYWLNIITSMGYPRDGDLGISYLSELDPIWDSSSLSMIIQPEAILFSNIIAQGACAADAVASLVGKHVDALFWCVGNRGSMYPFNGYVFSEFNPLQASLLSSERMAFGLYRQGIVMNSIGENTAACFEYPSPIIPKSRWQYHLVSKYPDTGQCHPLGRSATRWEVGKNMPNDWRNLGYLLWRKRNCVFL